MVFVGHHASQFYAFMLLVLTLAPLALYWQLVGGYVLGEYSGDNLSDT